MSNAAVDLINAIDPDLVQVFLAESQEKIDELDLLFIRLEESPNDNDVINQVFRAFHTIKGNSGIFGFKKVESLTHRGENLLDKIRNKELSINPIIIDTLLETVDGVKYYLGNLQNQGNEGSNDFQTTKEKLDAITKGTLLPNVEEKISTPIANTNNSAITIVDLDTGKPIEEVQNLKVFANPVLTDIPNTTSTTPSMEPNSQNSSDPLGVMKDAQTANIRVPIQLIERLMNEVGELVLVRNQINQLISKADLNSLEMASNTLDQVTTRLQENMMKTRLQPVGQVFNKFPRIVRDIAKASGKSIHFTMEGQNTEVDKTLLEAITDPLTHLIRNAVDHGIESILDREKSGKPKEGRIHLRAYHEGEHVIISLKDDGKGINPEVIKRKAIEKKMIDEATANNMSEKKLISLIMKPGFSTAEKVTNLSGRGVGMDVVKSEIEKVNGIVDIQSEVGVGSEFKLEIPLTLAIIPALIVTAHHLHFAIPQLNTAEVLQFEWHQYQKVIRSLKGTEFIFFRDELIPMIHLRRFLKLPEIESSQINEETVVTLVVVISGQERVALIVDSVINSEEIVVKPLIKRLKRIGCFNGCSILGDGTVTLILDTAGLMRMNDIEKQEIVLDEEQQEIHDRQHLLICQIGEKGRAAVPLLLINRIERITKESIQRVGNKEVVYFEGHLMPLIRLDNVLNITNLTDPEELEVLVFDYKSKHMGILIHRVLDSIEYEGTIDDTFSKSSGILGSIIMNNQGVALLDIFKLIEMEDPSWFEQINIEAGRTKDSVRKRILLVEDSLFYRRLEKEYLASSGYDITEAEDGQRALEILQEKQFDLILTDIEMPRVNGFELCEQARAKNIKIPIIALTTLTSEDAKKRAAQVGMNDYMIKISRQEILDKIDAIFNN